MLWTAGTFIQMFYIAHLHLTLVPFIMISFNIFFYSCFSKRIQKDAAVWNHKTRNFRHYEVFSLSASRISQHKKRYMLQRFCSIWCHAYFMQLYTAIHSVGGQQLICFTQELNCCLRRRQSTTGQFEGQSKWLLSLNPVDIQSLFSYTLYYMTQIN
jgi:hypothetical protein